MGVEVEVSSVGVEIHKALHNHHVVGDGIQKAVARQVHSRPALHTREGEVVDEVVGDSHAHRGQG